MFFTHVSLNTVETIFIRLCAFAFSVSSLRTSREGNERKDRLERRLTTKITAFGVNDRGEISPCYRLHAQANLVSRA